MSAQKNWFLVALASGLTAPALVAVAFLLPSPFAVALLAIGVVVFLFVLAHNPSFRYWRMASFVITGWLGARILPTLLARLRWRDDLLIEFWLNQEIGWSFDAAAVMIAFALIGVDYALGRAEGKWSGLLSLVTIKSDRQVTSHDGSRQARVGDVTGDHNVVTINQNQGVTPAEVALIVQAATPDANAEIDVAAERSKREPDVAIHLLSDLKKKRWDTLKSRERYRLLANLGHAHERKGDLRQAALLYLEAKQHQPEDERARALEAVAYHYLGDSAKAYALAGEVTAAYPTCALAAAVRVRSAPASMTFAALEESVPAALREDPEVVHALGWRAISSGDFVVAERLTRAGLSKSPQSAELKEQLGAVIVQAEARLSMEERRDPRADRLSEAVASLTAALAEARGAEDAARIRYTRAEAYDLMGQAEEAEADFRAALEGATEDAEVARRFAHFLVRRGRSDAAIELLRKAIGKKPGLQIRVFLASLLGERNRGDDREAATMILQEAILHAASDPPEMRSAVAGTLARLQGSLGHHDQALLGLDNLPPGFLSAADSKAVRAEALLRAGRQTEAALCAREARVGLFQGSAVWERMRVAEVLGYAGEHREALEIWKETLDPNCEESLACTAVECARRCGDEDYILSFCEKLRLSGVRIPYCLELEVLTLERFHVFDKAISVIRDYLAAPTNDDLARVFRVRLSMLGLRLNRPDLVENNAGLLPAVGAVPVRIGAATAYILSRGPDPTEGVKYAYELVRHHFSDAEARQAYVGIIGVGDEMIDFPTPAVVGPGCAVKYKADDSGDELWAIIEDGPDPKMERREFGPTHLLSRESAGKSIGDTFYLRRDRIQNRTATVVGIVSKYVYRKMEILTSWEDRFPDIQFVKKYTCPTKDDGSPDIAPILKAADLRAEHTEHLHAVYRENPISVATFAKLSEAGMLESLSHLGSEGSLPIRCCKGNAYELERAEAAFAAADSFIIDPSALATLFFSGQYVHLAILPGKGVVCESTLEEYRDLYQKFSSPTQGFMGKLGGKYFFKKDDPEERERQLRRLADFLDKIRSQVSVESGRKLAGMHAKRREELIALFGQPTAESIAAADCGAVLWTDDLAVAEVAAEGNGTKRVWSQLIFRQLAGMGRVPAAAYTDLTIFQVQWQYFFTRIEPITVAEAGRLAGWDPDQQPLAAVIKWFGIPEVDGNGIATLCAGTLPIVWRHAPLAHQREAVTRALIEVVIGRKDGRQIVAALLSNINPIFGLDLIGAENCRRVLQGMDRGEKRNGLILPGGTSLTG